jgi:transposase
MMTHPAEDLMNPTYCEEFNMEELAGGKAVAMDMWDPYTAATHAYVPQATEETAFDRWLANEGNVPERRPAGFDAIRKENLRTGRAWATKEALREFWNYAYRRCAQEVSSRWCFWATCSHLGPIIKVATTRKRHLPNVLTDVKHHISNATAEGLSSKIQVVKETACGFGNRDYYKLAIYFPCGGLDLCPATVRS